jgi:nitrous oxide reductase accessory protein NosL
MKTIIPIIVFSSCLSAISQFSVSGKPTNKCLDSLYSVELHNTHTRYHCSLYSVYNDDKLYGVNKSTLKKYNMQTKTFESSKELVFYNDKKYMDDKKYYQNIQKKYYYPYGEKVYNHYCQNTSFDFDSYFEITDLYGDIKEQCTTSDVNYLYSIAQYLWMKHYNRFENVQTLKVNESEKCPVCGMFVYKYPKWVAQIFMDDYHLSFDGVKDMMKFYVDPIRWNKKYKDIEFKEIKVTDYYTTKAIDARKAFYVLGSDIYGPMGRELIPFEKYDDAKEFLYDHKGKEIISFDKIDETLLSQLD